MLGAVLLAGGVTAAAGAPRGAAPGARVSPTLDVAYDVRVGGRRTAPVGASVARRTLPRSSATVARDPLNGGVDLVAKRGGFLTGRSATRPVRIALDYVRDRPRLFGLDEGDLGALRLTRRYSSESGATHLQWEQTYRGIPAFDQGLRANVAADGRLINVGGSPRPDLSVASTEPQIGPREALLGAARSVPADVQLGSAGPSLGPERSTEFDRDHRASLVLFTDPARVRLAWRVLLFAGPRGVFDAVVDAASGEVLYRNDLVRSFNALVFDNYPGAPLGGAQVLRPLPDAWLSATDGLFGPNAWVHADPNDTHFEQGTQPGPADEILPPYDDFNNVQDDRPPASGQNCPPPPFGCTWDNGNLGFSWTVNRDQAGTQLFYFVNRFHDHLRDAPGIAFGPSGSFEGADRVLAQVDDGARTGPGDFPDCEHTNNASMIVLPDGNPALMEAFLWTASAPGCPEPGVRDVNGADDAYLVYHEYTHGLSLRLVTDPSGFGALNGPQSAALGEGISDWYAFDFLEASGFEVDTSASGELRAGVYENAAVRTQAFDCPVGESTGACPGTPTAGPGGYTYGDFGRVGGGPEIHDDGEIWVETMWDLRGALIASHGRADGINRARALATDGMRLSPDNPTFLQMRDAILQADVNRGFGDTDLIWSVFAARGMGLNARTTGDSDTRPVEDFSVPARPQPPPPPPPPPATDTTAAVISGFTMTARRFRVGLDRTPRAAQRRRRVRVGSAFRFGLSERANVVISIERASTGRRVGARCRPASRRLRRRPRCVRYELRGSLIRRNRDAGRHVVAFSGRIGIKALRPGRHRATISATDAAGNASERRRTSFTIVRR